jgi:hypothetical protein
MVRDVPMQDPTRADFQNDEDVNQAEPRRHVTKKSQASTERAWLRTNALHA